MNSGGYLVSWEVARGICTSFTNTELNRDHVLVAQLVEPRAVTQEVVSLTPAGPTLRVLK